MLSDEYHETHEYVLLDERHEPEETHEYTLLDVYHELKETHECIPYAQSTSARDAGRAGLLKQGRQLALANAAFLADTVPFIRMEVS